jgi:hypothetical protein
MGAAGQSDRRDHGVDDLISRHCQQGEAEQKEGSSSAVATAAAEWSR